MKNRLLLLLFPFLAAPAPAAIVIPTIADASGSNPFNGSGLSVSLTTAAPLAAALLDLLGALGRIRRSH